MGAANAFLVSLTGGQRSEALYTFSDPVRSNWSNLPSGVPKFDRNGVRIGDLDTAQTEAMLLFLASTLSADGYETTLGVLGADAFLAEAESDDRFGDHNDWVAFFGEPSDDSTWGWQLGGHHLAINVTVASGRSYLSPTFVGVELASHSAGDATAPLDAHLQACLALINALDEDQRIAATISSRPDGLLTGAGEDGVIPPVEGSIVAGWAGLDGRQYRFRVVDGPVSLMGPSAPTLWCDRAEQRKNCHRVPFRIVQPIWVSSLARRQLGCQSRYGEAPGFMVAARLMAWDLYHSAQRTARRGRRWIPVALQEVPMRHLFPRVERHFHSQPLFQLGQTQRAITAAPTDLRLQEHSG